MAASDKTKGRAKKGGETRSYAHPEASALLRPDVGTQAQFRKKKPPATYHYDPSLSPALDWDQQNPAREQAEAKIAALAGTVSAPFRAGEHGQIAVKAIDDRGNELIVAKSLSEAGK